MKNAEIESTEKGEKIPKRVTDGSEIFFVRQAVQASRRGGRFTFGQNGSIISVMGFGNRIKELRVLNALTQAQLAEKVGVDPSAISLWENDINEPKASYIVRLALTFSVSADYILGIEDEAGSKLMH